MLRSPSGLTWVEVLLRQSTFCVKSGEHGALKKACRVSWGESATVAWNDICTKFGWH
jgi:hypothetical protein